MYSKNSLSVILVTSWGPDIYSFRSSRPDVFCKKGVLEISQNSQENTCAGVAILKNY